MVRTLVAAAVLVTSLLPLSARAAGLEASESSDHDLVIRKFGLTYFGPLNMSLGDNPNGAGVNAQLIGVRYWLDDRLGVDAALGLGISTGSTKLGGTSTDLTTPNAYAFLVGVPFSVYSGQHYTFFAEPEIRMGFASESDKTLGTTVDFSGFRFDFGARAGAEIHFGFIGIPQLALDATLSLLATVRTGSITPSGGTETSFSTFQINTDLQNQPWNIFVTNVMVRYYF